jgi:hypothetical protein
LAFCFAVGLPLLFFCFPGNGYFILTILPVTFGAAFRQMFLHNGLFPNLEFEDATKSVYAFSHFFTRNFLPVRHAASVRGKFISVNPRSSAVKIDFGTSPQSSPRSRWRGRSVRVFGVVRGYEFGPRGAPPSEICDNS